MNILLIFSAALLIPLTSGSSLNPKSMIGISVPPTPEEVGSPPPSAPLLLKEFISSKPPSNLFISLAVFLAVSPVSFKAAL